MPLSLLLVRDASPGITDASYHGLFTIFFSFQRSLSAFFSSCFPSLFLMRAIQSRINVTRAKSVATPAKFTTRFIAESIRAISDGHFYSRLYGSRIELKQTSRERRIASPSRNLILLHSFHPSFSLFLSFFSLCHSLALSRFHVRRYFSLLFYYPWKIEFRLFLRSPARAVHSDGLCLVRFPLCACEHERASEPQHLLWNFSSTQFYPRTG